ncbi:MAG: hypothetical protein AAFU03_09555, partial [Bacteroidota bacterium]
VCDQGVNTYGADIPILGVDYFRGPLNEFGEELGMSSFIYINNSAPGNPPPGTLDPQTRGEFYNYLQGIWQDGTPLELGGDGYDEGTGPTRYAFPDGPNDENGWSMCTQDLGLGDRRTLQASGPFTLQPGAVNELIIGVVWVADQIYPCPSLRRLFLADDIAQDLFDACFKLPETPDAPDVDWVELDREVIALLSNRRSSNNFNESFAAQGLGIPEGEDSLYRFEGYRIFQFSGPEVSIADIDDPEKVRIVAEVDLINGVQTVFNWNGLNPEDPEFPVPTEDIYFVPELMVDGQDNGIRHSFRITDDRFANGDTRLINHRRYYFTAIAYAYNNYKQFDPDDNLDPGQPEPYIDSDRNIGDQDAGLPFYTVIPRPILDRDLMADYGDAPEITRLAGRGNNGNFLDISEDSRAEIEAAIAADATFDGPVTYQSGAGPIDVIVVNPRLVMDGDYQITFQDDDNSDDEYTGPVTWTLQCTDGCGTDAIVSERPISEANEQIIAEFGFSVNIGDVEEPGSDPFGTNGAIGGSLTYADNEGPRWLTFIPDNLTIGLPGAIDANLYDYVDTELTDIFETLDPNQQLSENFPGVSPYKLLGWSAKPNLPFFISPVWRNSFNNIPNRTNTLENLNNVDIVFTSDKSLWSRCPVIETRTGDDEYVLQPSIDPAFENDGAPIMFDTRSARSVTKEADADGLPVVDDTTELVRGMGWFPGYAIDVETGQRLEIFWGENSVYNGQDLGNGFNIQN